MFVTTSSRIRQTVPGLTERIQKLFPTFAGLVGIEDSTVRRQAEETRSKQAGASLWHIAHSPIHIMSLMPAVASWSRERTAAAGDRQQPNGQTTETRRRQESCLV
jgi:hypothetical protein